MKLQELEKYSEVVLIDLSWVMHRSIHVFKNFFVSPVSGTEIPTGHIYGVLYSIETFLEGNKDRAVVIVVDGYPEERINLALSHGVEYKAGRPELEYDIYQDVKSIIMLASASPRVFVSYNRDRESDDVMYCISRKIKNKIWINSGDNDLLQSITNDGRVQVTRSFCNGEIVPITYDSVQKDQNFIKKFKGVAPDKLVFFRSVVGDSSDRIKGIPRFNRDVLVELVSHCSELCDMFTYHSLDTKTEKWLGVLRENKELVELNYRLMKLERDFEPNVTRVTKLDMTKVTKLISYFKLRRWYKYLLSLSSN